MLKAIDVIKPVRFQYGDIVFESVEPSEKEKIDKIHKLRHEVFVKKLAWVPSTPEEYERDSYDEYSLLFGVFKGEDIVGTARFTLHPWPFMLDKDFADMLNGHPLPYRGQAAVELSRLGILPSMEDKKKSRRVAMLLYRGLYEWSLRNAVRYWYLVSTERYISSLRRRLRIPVTQLGKTLETDDGERYHAAMIDLKEARRSMGLIRYIAFRWFLR